MAAVLQLLETRQAWKLTARFVITFEPCFAPIAWNVGHGGADSHPYFDDFRRREAEQEFLESWCDAEQDHAEQDWFYAEERMCQQGGAGTQAELCFNWI